jgi:hypothetical protein
LASATKPPEELYDTQSDPYEIHNLAHSPEHQAILEQMRQAHQSWVLRTHDTGLLPEAEMYLRSEGLPPYEMVRMPGKFPQERILQAADLVGRGAGSRSKLVALLSDADRAVRYWAAVGLTALGPDAAPARGALFQRLSDPAPNVRLAAAEALCRLGHEKEAVPVIAEGLKHEDDWVRLHAAVVLAAVGEKARAAVPDMKQAINEGRKHQATPYVRWALDRALQQLGDRGS